MTRLTTLSNGFRVATDHMPGLRSSALSIYVLAGSRNEREDQNGIAHFLEHMAFKGTKSRTAIQIAQSIEDVGGFINAYTSMDRTAYFIRVLEEDVSFGIELLSDILLNSVYSPGEIEKERNVILNEIRQYKDYPEDVIFEGLQKTIYPHQPLGRPILGSSELVGTYQRNNLVEFVNQFYSPQNMILAAAGAVDHDAIVVIAEQYFGHLEMLPTEDFVQCNYQNGEYREEKDIEQVQFVLACESPPIDHDLEAATNIYTRVLGGGSSSRLFVEAREKRGLCYSISAQA
ncbi:MAG: pitrilysin family protein, partial [Rhodobacteraceae bacterium]|nr:pitrilysin family protein [Paracoccaceae bacterium]